ncbi:MAG: GNAT family N-acetyltransferase [Bacteroidia bacterium]|nr:MAG: GNAT family N-acetyltransferase [Bacteroidia bacterium]
MKDLELNIRRVSTHKESLSCAELMAGSEPWITLGMDRDHVVNIFNDPLNEVFAAYIGEALVGTMVIQTKGAFTGYLKSIVVKPDRRGQKLGEKMMAFIEKEIFATCANLFLCVSSFNREAQRFYQRLGYEKIGVLKNYLVDGHDEILMRKTIAPILEKTGNSPSESVPED